MPRHDEDPLDAMLAAAAAKLPTVTLQEILRARREAEQAPPPPPSVIPQPDFPALGVVRYYCPVGCGWWHDERPGLDATAQPMALRLPAGFTSEDVSAAITEQAGERQRAYLGRVEQAIADHYATAHPTI